MSRRTVEGVVKEIGLKTNLWDGRLISTITFFDLTLDNLRSEVFDPVGGLNFFIVSEKEQVNRGIEVDLGVKPLPNLTIIATAYAGDLVDQDGGKLPSVIDNSYSFLAKYDFIEGPLTGFSAGAPASFDEVALSWDLEFLTKREECFRDQFGVSVGTILVCLRSCLEPFGKRPVRDIVSH